MKGNVGVDDEDWGGVGRGEVDNRGDGGRRARAEGGADTIIVNGPEEL